MSKPQLQAQTAGAASSGQVCCCDELSCELSLFASSIHALHFICITHVLTKFTTQAPTPVQQSLWCQPRQVAACTSLLSSRAQQLLAATMSSAPPTLPPELDVPEGSALHRFLLMRQERISRLEDDTGRLLALLQPEQKAALTLPPGVAIGSQAKFSTRAEACPGGQISSHYYCECTFEGALDAEAAQEALAADLVASLKPEKTGYDFAYLTWHSEGNKVFGLLELMNVFSTEAVVAGAVYRAIHTHMSCQPEPEAAKGLSVNLKPVRYAEAFELHAEYAGATCMSLQTEQPHIERRYEADYTPGDGFYDLHKQIVSDVQSLTDGIAAPFGIPAR